MKLSILIPVLMPRDKVSFDSLVADLKNQRERGGYDCGIIWDESNRTIGTKRNDLLKNSNSDYVSFIDADDTVSRDYLKNIFEGINKGVDCCSLRGVITWDGENPELFEHSVKYKAYSTTANTIKYERYPNHLNCIKSSIAKQFRFPETNHGEDTEWATQIYRSGLIKTEHFIDKVLYNYLYKTSK